MLIITRDYMLRSVKFSELKQKFQEYNNTKRRLRLKRVTRNGKILTFRPLTKLTYRWVPN